MVELVLVAVAVVAYTELLHYAVVLAGCSWPKGPDGPSLHLMLLADTHLLGRRKGHWFDKLRRFQRP